MTTKTKKSLKSSPEFDYKTIKTFEDACKKLDMDPMKLPDVSGIPEEFKKPIISGFKLMIIYKAINNGWIPNWNDYKQWKYFPWFNILSSGFGFSSSDCLCDSGLTCVGSRFCTDTSEKALYIAGQFKTEYQEYFLYSE